MYRCIAGGIVMSTIVSLLYYFFGECAVLGFISFFIGVIWIEVSQKN